MNAHGQIHLIFGEGDGGRRVELPGRIFSSMAEQLRWDLFRGGQLSLNDWHTAQACAVLEQPAKSGEPARVVINLTVGDNIRASRTCSAGALQGLDMFLHSELENCPDHSHGAFRHIALEQTGADGERGAPVPLSPFQVPIAEPLPNSGQTHRVELAVCEQARSALMGMSRDSLDRETELGACLIGHMPDPDTLAITRVLRTSGETASPMECAFEPDFWVRANAGLAGTDERVFGWAHSHLCDLGHPRCLSYRDLTVFHTHFAAPWSVGALVCASREHSEVRWFGWRDGNVAAIAARTMNAQTAPVS